MNRFKNTLKAFPLAALACVGTFDVASAQDGATLEAAIIDWYEKLNNEDPNYLIHTHEMSTIYPRNGSLLNNSVTSMADVQADFDAGLNFDVQLHHLQAIVYGDTGVATYYTTGPTAYPDGTLLRGIFRASVTATWEGSQWKFVHIHISPLQSGPGE